MRTLLLIVLLIISTRLHSQDVGIERIELSNISKFDSINLVNNWRIFKANLSAGNVQQIERMSLPEVFCSICDSFDIRYDKSVTVPISEFLYQTKKTLLDSRLGFAIKSNYYKIIGIRSFDFRPTTYNLKPSEVFEVYSIAFRTIEPGFTLKRDMMHEFLFVKVNDVFKFYGLESH